MLLAVGMQVAVLVGAIHTVWSKKGKPVDTQVAVLVGTVHTVWSKKGKTVLMVFAVDTQVVVLVGTIHTVWSKNKKLCGRCLYCLQWARRVVVLVGTDKFILLTPT